MSLLDSLLDILPGKPLGPPLPVLVEGRGSQEELDRWEQTDKFMSSVERQRRKDLYFLRCGLFPSVKFTFLTPLQKTAYACWRDTTDLEFPGAKPIQIEILRELRRLNAGI